MWATLVSSIVMPGIRRWDQASACLKILDIFRARTEVGIARPLLGAAAHLAAIAHPEQQGALGAGDPFVQFAGRMHDKGARLDCDGFLGRAHGAAALEAEIDLGGVRVTVIRAGLTWLPAGDRHVALGDPAEHP